jgi:hypothetical protein
MERIGQDSLIQNLCRLTLPEARWVRSPARTYHRVRRPGSLTQSPLTGHRSPARLAMVERNRTVIRRAQTLWPDLAAIRAYRASLVEPEVAAALESEVARLAARFAEADR